VSKLVLFGGFARGWRERGDPDEVAQREALLTLVRRGWGKENPAFRQVFTSMFLPEGTPEQMQAFNELQRISASPENAARLMEAFSAIDVVELLPRVSVPTLVLHCRNDARVPYGSGRQLASEIPGARFVTLDSRNHLPLEHEPAWRRMIEEIARFLLEDEAAADPDAAHAVDGHANHRTHSGSAAWHEADRLFDEALAQPAREREAWLRRRCADRPELLDRVRRLLQLGERATDELRTGGALAGEIGADALDDDAGLAPGERLGPYIIGERLGSGGMGVVHRARHERLGRDVAIKALPGAAPLRGDALQRFEREARLLATLDHPNVATVHDFLVVGGRPYLVLELIDGECLSERIARGPLPLGDALSVARGIAAALEEAHGTGVVHRDLKPGNVKIDTRGRVKVLDFGLAKAFGPGEKGSSFSTGVSALLGTPGYMSPEQARGAEVDARADVWAFGCVLYEMLSGVRAFDGPTASDAIAAVLRDEPSPSRLPSSTPAVLRELVSRCLEKDPARRPRTMEGVRLALSRVDEDGAG
jgi:hypothetical protein